MIEKIQSYSPKEVYVLSAAYLLTLFLNFSEFMDSRFRVGDDHIRHDDAIVLYWVILLTSALLITLKARRISEWLWQR